MRVCQDCGTDIHERHALAYLCAKCSRKRLLARKRRYYNALPDAMRVGRHDRPERAPERRKVTA